MKTAGAHGPDYLGPPITSLLSLRPVGDRVPGPHARDPVYPNGPARPTPPPPNSSKLLQDVRDGVVNRYDWHRVVLNPLGVGENALVSHTRIIDLGNDHPMASVGGDVNEQWCQVLHRWRRKRP